jgi:hypothetical protein
MINKASLYEALWQSAQVSPDWATAIDGVACSLREVEPTVRLGHRGPGQISGCVWTLYVDGDGRGRGPRAGGWPDGAIAMWEVALSYRAPLITALSWSDPRLAADEMTCPRLVGLVQGMARTLGLTYVDAREMGEWEIPWDELKGDAELRLDYSETATAFNLLFYEG